MEDAIFEDEFWLAVAVGVAVDVTVGVTDFVKPALLDPGDELKDH